MAITDNSKAWGNFVRDKRKALMYTRRRLAELTQIDPSYVTLIERDGYVPQFKIVDRLSRALKAGDGIYIIAGYVPPGKKTLMLAALHGASCS